MNIGSKVKVSNQIYEGQLSPRVKNGAQGVILSRVGNTACYKVDINNKIVVLHEKYLEKLK